MKKILLVILIALLLMAFPGTAFADPGTGDCVKTVKAIIDAGLDSPNDTDSNHGDAISDGFFGNEPNLPDSDLDLGPNEVDPGSGAGSVVPSQSPGPQVNNGGFTTWGSVIHDVVKDNCAH